MTKRFSTALCLSLLLLSMATPVSVAVDGTVTGTTGAVTTDSAATSEAPLSMTPEQIAALNGEVPDSTDNGDQSTFSKASDFVTDHAPLFIIGIVILAAILAGFFIMRGRSRSPKAPKAAKAGRVAAGAPASVPSASEIRRRKRAAMQRSREEERLRRKDGLEGRQASQTSTLPLSANQSLDPVQAEKQSARDQLQAAAAVARSGPVPAPASPSQTAPTPGVTAFDLPETTLSGAATAAGLAPASAAAETQVPAGPAGNEFPQNDPPTQVYDVPSDLYEPAIEAPGLDARVGEAAAAFSAGAVGGGLGARALTGREGDEAPAGSPAADPEDPADDAAREAEQRLRAKVAEIKAEQGRGLGRAPVPAPPAPMAPAVPVTPPAGEPEVRKPSIEDRLDEAEDLQREAATSEAVPPTPTGLAAVEQRLQESSDQRDRALREAEARLRRIEQRAEDAEKRAAFAERLAQLKVDETDRERRLNEVISGIDRAEERTKEAEARAKAAEATASSALEGTARPTPLPPEPEPYRSPEPEPRHSDRAPAPQAYMEQSQPVASPPPLLPQDGEEQPARPIARSPLFNRGSSGPRSSSDSLNLNTATFEELRDADLSVTQATRILAYRERFGGYRSVEDLERVPGFPAELIESLRGRITV